MPPADSTLLCAFDSGFDIAAPEGSGARSNGAGTGACALGTGASEAAGAGARKAGSCVWSGIGTCIGTEGSVVARPWLNAMG